jgi:hypothetical protein
MENKPIHYDGSIQTNGDNSTNSVTAANEPFEMTEEIRKNIGGNPFVIE